MGVDLGLLQRKSEMAEAVRMGELEMGLLPWFQLQVR
jgi:hypothetical protein